MVAGLLLFSCSEKQVTSNGLTIINKAISDTSSIFYADFENYPDTLSVLPIGIMDSGTGGLAILERFLTADEYDNITGKLVADNIGDFVGENLTYLADIANVPYVGYLNKGKKDFLRELMLKNTLFMMGDSYFSLAFDDEPMKGKEKVKLLIVGSSIAATYAMNDVEELLRLSNTGVQAISVVEATASEVSRQLTVDDAVGIISNTNVLQSKIYDNLLGINLVKQMSYGFTEDMKMGENLIDKTLGAPRASYSGPVFGENVENINVELLPRYNFSLENNDILYSRIGRKFKEIQLNSMENYARFSLMSLVEKHRKNADGKKLKFVILDCEYSVHYKDVLETMVASLRDYQQDGKYIYKNCISEDFQFIDPSLAVVKQAYSILRKSEILSMNLKKTKVESFISIPAYGEGTIQVGDYHWFRDDYKFGRFVGTELQTFKMVPFALKYLDQETVRNIEIVAPKSYKLINNKLY